jgi:hypothetical protein
VLLGHYRTAIKRSSNACSARFQRDRNESWLIHCNAIVFILLRNMMLHSTPNILAQSVVLVLLFPLSAQSLSITSLNVMFSMSSSECNVCPLAAQCSAANQIVNATPYLTGACNYSTGAVTNLTIQSISLFNNAPGVTLSGDVTVEWLRFYNFSWFAYLGFVDTGIVVQNCAALKSLHVEYTTLGRGYYVDFTVTGNPLLAEIYASNFVMSFFANDAFYLTATISNNPALQNITLLDSVFQNDGYGDSFTVQNNRNLLSISMRNTAMCSCQISGHALLASLELSNFTLPGPNAASFIVTGNAALSQLSMNSAVFCTHGLAFSVTENANLTDLSFSNTTFCAGSALSSFDISHNKLDECVPSIVAQLVFQSNTSGCVIQTGTDNNCFDDLTPCVATPAQCVCKPRTLSLCATAMSCSMSVLTTTSSNPYPPGTSTLTKTNAQLATSTTFKTPPPPTTTTTTMTPMPTINNDSASTPTLSLPSSSVSLRTDDLSSSAATTTTIVAETTIAVPIAMADIATDVLFVPIVIVGAACLLLMSIGVCIVCWQRRMIQSLTNKRKFVCTFFCPCHSSVVIFRSRCTGSRTTTTACVWRSLSKSYSSSALTF